MYGDIGRLSEGHPTRDWIRMFGLLRSLGASFVAIVCVCTIGGPACAQLASGPVIDLTFPKPSPLAQPDSSTRAVTSPATTPSSLPSPSSTAPSKPAIKALPVSLPPQSFLLQRSQATRADESLVQSEVKPEGQSAQPFIPPPPTSAAPSSAPSHHPADTTCQLAITRGS